MSDFSINSVSNVRVTDSAAPVPAGVAGQATQSAPAMPVTATGAIPSVQGRAEQSATKQGAQAPGQLEVMAQKQIPQEEQKKAAETEKKNNLPLQSMNNVTLRFSVDDKTNAITVFVIDKASKRVLRSIPAQDLNKMQAGDLLQLLA